MQGRKPEEEIQQPAFLHGYAKIYAKSRGGVAAGLRAGLSERQFCMAMQNFAHHEKPQEATKEISHTMPNFAWYAKSSCAPTPLDFYLKIFCVIS